MFRIIVLLLVLPLASCTPVTLQTYQNESPKLDMRTFFDGRIDAWGMFQKRSGEVVKRFHVQMDAHSEGDKLILDERFTYNDGTKQRRVWTLTSPSEGVWRGIADDVVGEALGEVQGNTLRWRYTLQLPVDGTVYEVKLDDWMYLIDENTMANRSFMSKFGVEVGQITLFFRKQVN